MASLPQPGLKWGRQPVAGPRLAGAAAPGNDAWLAWPRLRAVLPAAGLARLSRPALPVPRGTGSGRPIVRMGRVRPEGAVAAAQ